MFAGQDFGFKLQVIVTVLVAVAVIWAGLQTGDWSGLILVVPLAILIPITAKLPKEPPRRRQAREAGQAGKGGKSGKAEDNEPKRY